MELLVLDKDFKAIKLVDFFESSIWTDRYNEYGDFELYVPVNSEYIEYLKHDYYLTIHDSEHTMIIESIELTTDFEEGNHLTVKGRSLESILERRIIWKQTTVSGNLQNAVEKLLNENIINPTDSSRKITNFIFERSTDTNITNLTIKESQFTGDNLYDVISSFCKSNRIGFRIFLNEQNNFVFKLYVGQNRSYDQNANPYVVFAPTFENIVNSNYFEDKTNYKTVTLVAGEGEGSERKTTTVSATNDTGLTRRELYTDARDISSTVNGEQISDAQYYEQLASRGRAKLLENDLQKVFDGQAEVTQLFVLGKDFFMGDIIQLTNEYHMEAKSQIIEIIITHNEQGEYIYPTFEVVK